MNNYLLTIILVSICIGILDIIAPNNEGISKYTKTIGLLIILCVLIAPINDAVKTIDDGFLNKIKDEILLDTESMDKEYENILNNYLNEHSIMELQNQIKEILNNNFDIPSDECEIKVITQHSEDALHLNEIKIILSGKSIFKNPYSIEEHFHKLFKCNCTVVIK